MVCVSDAAASSSDGSSDSSSSSSTLIIVVVALAVVVVLGVAGFFLYRRRMKNRGFYLSNTPDMVGVATPPSSNNTPARIRAGSRGRASSQQRPPTAGGRTPRSSIPNLFQLAGISDHGKKMSDAQPRRSSAQSTFPVVADGHRSRSSIISSTVVQIPSDQINYTRKIAKGAFGEVWLALYGKDLVAVKKLITVEGTSVQDFVSELNLLASLSHRCILTLIGACWDEELTDIQIVMEYMDSGDLLSVLRKNPPSVLTWESGKATYCVQVCEAVYYLHSLQPALIHRDIKSRNILVDSQKGAKLSDFGESRERTVARTMTAGVGTARWVAPEIILGEDYSELADIYSLGVLLTELDTHQIPYQTLGLEESMIVQQVAVGKLRPKVSDTCPEIIRRLTHECLQYDPSLRPSAARVFRLVLKLEAQKALDVNVAALEQRFRVPPGYADDESLNARGEFVPGPGTYEVPQQWPARDVTSTPTSAFISRTIRGPFSPERRVASASPNSSSRQAVLEKNGHASADKLLRPHTASAELSSPAPATKSPRTRLRLPSSSGRRDLFIQVPEVQHSGARPAEVESAHDYSSLKPLNASSFSKVGRETEIDRDTAPPVGSYNIKRLWDSTSRRTTIGAPSHAIFGASREKRIVTWRPALTPASYTVSTSWDSSRHYARLKDKVVRCATKRKLHSAKLHARTMSSPTLRSSTVDATVADVAPTELFEEDDDPFNWLRQRPNGEQRVNFLAAKHGLVHHIKSPTRRSTENRANHLEEQAIAGTPNFKPVRQHSNLREDETMATHSAYTAKPKDVRIKVSCRMPGGMLITASVYSMKKLGHFKSAILVRQKRFQSVEQFDLYLSSGRKLTGLEDTLVSCGIRDRSMLQIVPAVTVALTPQGNTPGNQSALNLLALASAPPIMRPKNTSGGMGSKANQREAIPRGDVFLFGKARTSLASDGVVMPISRTGSKSVMHLPGARTETAAKYGEGDISSSAELVARNVVAAGAADSHGVNPVWRRDAETSARAQAAQRGPYRMVSA
ncbi:unnamed protein product [Phytophthora lilii]|uniref:Unnamed protein product n=1 Tax=Phytophthora lilii TaxID=2077276 RepID=A0A9W6TEY8_9STRA|nr:unnamed protein product [Phytophthora lilii]